MRDRLDDLSVIQEDSEADGASCSESDEWDEDDFDGDLKHEAIVFEESSDMHVVLKEAQMMRKEIAELQMDVDRLRKQTTHGSNTVRRFSVIQRSSNAIGVDVKKRAEAICKHLSDYDHQRQKLEEQHGQSAAVVRIARAQHVSIGHALRQAMADYNTAEQEQRECCSQRFQRHAEILGHRITSEEVEQIIAEGGWGAFSQELHPEGMNARCAYQKIKDQHKELMELETRLRDVHELFVQMAVIVEQQSVMIDNIEANVLATDNYLESVNEKLKIAVHYRKKNPCFRIFCSCFPCWKNTRG